MPREARWLTRSRWPRRCAPGVSGAPRSMCFPSSRPRLTIRSFTRRTLCSRRMPRRTQKNRCRGWLFRLPKMCCWFCGASGPATWAIPKCSRSDRAPTTGAVRGMGVFTNRVKQLLQRGEPAVGHWISFPSPAVVELMATAGMDWLLIDTEHGATDWETVEDMIRALKGTEVVPLVRVGANDPALFKRALDRGALGTITPMVSTPEQAKAAVAASKDPPGGIRGVAGSRGNRYRGDLARDVAGWDDQVLVILQVETVEALKNIDAIAAVPGGDAVFIGPNALTAGLGDFRQCDRPESISAATKRLQATRTPGKIP